MLRVPDDVFVKVFNESDNATIAAARLGIQVVSCHERARKLRNAGYTLKRTKAGRPKKSSGVTLLERDIVSMMYALKNMAKDLGGKKELIELVNLTV